MFLVQMALNIIDEETQAIKEKASKKAVALDK
jgi:hypothetical protein